MAKKQYTIEKEGQLDFFDNYRIDYKNNPVIVDNTDGVYNGNIFEFKLNINNTGKVLFQAIKYLSKMRLKGESIPARILLIDLNDTKVYVYNSIDYIDDIQKVYIGAASTNNDTFGSNIKPVAKYDYSEDVDSQKVKEILINEVDNPTDWYIPIDLDENCIVGWAERYYREVPKATKGDFLGDDNGKVKIIGEIREPRHFKGLINPYTSPTNEKSKYLMDCLNDRLNKKDLGAFYTPMPYCEKASELVMQAVERVPDGNDYIILDRCAGTGNLESALIGKYDKNGSELISHCVVSTYEYYEYKVLSERIGDKVRNIIPPTEANVEYANGKVSNADAMSKEFIDNPLIKQYVDNHKCTIILFENPPYRDSTKGNNESENNNTSQGRTSYVKEQMSLNHFGKNAVNDLSNLFIWSAWKFFLRQQTDSYVVFSPIKHWKSVGISNKKIIDGFLFNRKHFHATSSAISCLFFSNAFDDNDSINLDCFDINDKEEIINVKTVTIRKTLLPMSKLYHFEKSDDDVLNGIYCERNGDETNRPERIKPIYNNNIICYLRANGFGLDANSINLTRIGLYNANGFYIRIENYLKDIPLFVAKQFPQDNWYDRDIYFTTADGKDKYTKDKNFLKSCLIYTCLSNQNKCLSFNGSDGRYYRNELCFDNTNGDTVALVDFKKMNLDDDEQKLIGLWNNILNEAKKTKYYDSKLTYGVYQITKELNTFEKKAKGTRNAMEIIYDYPELNSYLTTLRSSLKEYYKSHITDKMFEYELLK